MKNIYQSSPLKSWNPFNMFYMSWVYPMLKKASKKEIVVQDAPQIDEELEYLHYSNKVRYYFEEIKKNQDKPSNFFIINLVFKTFKFEILLFMLMSVVYETIEFFSIYLIQKILKLQEISDIDEQHKNYAIYIGTLFVFMFFSKTINNWLEFRMTLFATKTSYSISRLVLDKTLSYSQFIQKDINLGDIINFGTVDSNKFYTLSYVLIYLFLAPLMIIFGLIYFYILVGKYIFIGLGFTFLMMFVNILFVKQRMKYDQKFLEVAGKRVKKFNEIFHNIIYVKSSNYENHFFNMLSKIRNKEMFWNKKYFINSSIIVGGLYFTTTILYISTFVSFVYFGNVITISMIFTFMAVYDNIRMALNYLPYLISLLVEILISSRRLGKFLFSEEVQQPLNSYDENSGFEIDLKNAVFTYGQISQEELENKKKKEKNEKKGENLTEPLLQEQEQQKKENFALEIESLKIKKGELVAIIGKIGSGKSSFLLSLLGELQYEKNENFKFAVNQNISYIQQKPWIFNGSMKENILMGSEYNEEKYSSVIYYAGLKQDLELMQNADNTIIGDKGKNLSGGQQVRLALARCLYQDKDVFLLDDPLSALDINVGSFIMNQMIVKKLKDKTRLIVTHNLTHLSEFDKIMLMDKGKVIFMGTYEEIQNHPNFIEIQKILKKTEMDMKNVETITEKNKTSEEPIQKIFQSVQIKEDNIDDINVRKELEENADVGYSSYINYVKLGKFSNLFFLIVNLILSMLLTGYQYYFYNNASESSRNKFDPNYFLKMFIALNLGITVTQFFRLIFCYMFGINISTKLHGLMSLKVLYSSINSFFNKNPIGKVLNRFSGDIMVIDRDISFNQSTGLFQITQMFVNISLIIIFTNWYLGIIIIVIFYFLFKLRTKFSTANIILKKYESVTKSPYYSLFSDFASGNFIIRTFDKHDYYMDKTRQIVNKNFRCVLLYQGSIFWFSIRVFFLIFSFSIPLYIYIIFFNTQSLAYISILLISMIKSLQLSMDMMNMINQFENNMVAFERCYSYLQLEPEQGIKSIDFEIDQIQNKNLEQIIEETDDQLFERIKVQEIGKGVIKFQDVSGQYAKDSEKILKEINFSIQPGEKIGIIGRTGAGKSSLMKIMLHFLDEIEGKILIDDYNILQEDVRFLRRQVFYISQDSYFFEDNLRNNLDFENKFSDEEIINLLIEAEIWEYVEKEGGLDWKIEEKGNNLSQGQKQIFCFLRAVIKNKKIIVMDEATSNVDVQTEDIIEKIKENYFKDKTVLTIAHRLNTIYNSDRVMILEQGRIKAFKKQSEFTEEENQFFVQYMEDLKKGIIEQIIQKN